MRVDRAIAVLLGAIALALGWSYTLPSPYFLDSFGYVAWIREWAQGNPLPSYYRYANTLLYYVPVRLFGELGLKLVSVAVLTALAGAYFAMLRRDFSRAVALGASLLFLSSPAFVISTTHLKEDATSLLCFTITILFVHAQPSRLRVAAAGITFGLALLFKEVMLGAVPFVLAYLYVKGGGLERYRECFSFAALRDALPRTALFVFAALVTVLAISPSRISDFTTMASSPYMGQFLGLFSPLQRQGLAFWAEALLYLHPVYCLPVAFFAFALGRVSILRMLYLAMALVLLLFLTNVTVVRMRHFSPVLFFLAPVIADGTRELGSQLRRLLGFPVRRRWGDAVLVALCLAVAGAQLAYVEPTLDHRLRYNAARGFYRPLAERLPSDSLLLGMDYCPIATYESGLACRNRRPDLDRRRALAYVENVAELAARRPVYVLQDFAAYDLRGEVRRAFRERFERELVYEGWWEPYHLMTYGRRLDEDQFVRRGGRGDCRLTERRQSLVRISPALALDELRARVQCEDGRSDSLRLLSYRGHRTDLMRGAVYRLIPQQAG